MPERKRFFLIEVFPNFLVTSSNLIRAAIYFSQNTSVTGNTDRQRHTFWNALKACYHLFLSDIQWSVYFAGVHLGGLVAVFQVGTIRDLILAVTSSQLAAAAPSRLPNPSSLHQNHLDSWKGRLAKLSECCKQRRL